LRTTGGPCGAALAGVDLGEAVRLMDFVPDRLQNPFLEGPLPGVDKGTWMVFEQPIPAITNAHFETARPLYRCDSDVWNNCSCLTWHADWLRYLERHFPLLRGWTAWH
jgi:hypothetical protein